MLSCNVRTFANCVSFKLLGTFVIQTDSKAVGDALVVPVQVEKK